MSLLWEAAENPRDGAGLYLLHYTILPCNKPSETPGALTAPFSSTFLLRSIRHR